MKLEVSIGESVDKLSILELKHTKISDTFKLEEIQKEIDAIQEVQIYKTQLPFFYSLLYYVNDKIWTMTDEIKSMDISNIQYSSLSYEIFDYNQKRFRIKHFFNKLLDSNIKEQKSYASTVCLLTISDENILFSKLSEIFYLSISYDILMIDSIYKDIISKILIVPSIQFINFSSIENNCINTYSINLSEYSISNDLQNMFSLEPIKYVCGGLLGDFIHSLSVINEKYRETGRKGVLYISNHHGGEIFRYGIEKTYEDTFEIVTNQDYILSYSIYKETDSGVYDINLNEWRNSKYLFKENLCFIYNNSYNISSWGQHPWIKLPSTFKKDSKWENKIIINTTSQRFPRYINFQKLYENSGEDLIFVSMEKSNYDNFIKNTRLTEINFYNLESFTELCFILSSCKLFIGSFSSPLSTAFAIHTHCIPAKHNNENDNRHFYDLDKCLPFIVKIE